MNSKHKALEAKAGTAIGKTSEGKIILKKPRMLTAKERAEKTKSWKGSEINEHEKHSYQHRIGRAYSD